MRPIDEHGLRLSGDEITVDWVREDDDVRLLMEEWTGERRRFVAIAFAQDLAQLALERLYRRRRIEFLVARSEGRLVGYACLAPLDTAMPLAFGLKTLLRPRVKRLRMIGGDAAIADNVDDLTVLRALFGKLAKDQSRLITIEECADTSRIHRYAADLAPFKLKALEKDPQTIHTIDLPENFDAYLKLHKGKTRNTLKRRVRIFGEKFEGGARLERFDAPESIEQFVDAVGAIFERSWKRGVLSETPPVAQDDIPYLKELARRGLLRSYVLYGGDDPICCSLMTQTNGFCDFLDVLFVQEHSQLAPGQVLIFKIIEDLYEHNTPSEFNFGYGENTYKRVFGTRSYSANFYYAVMPFTKAAAVVSAQLALRRSYHAARKTLVALKIDHKIRRLLKRGGSKSSADAAGG